MPKTYPFLSNFLAIGLSTFATFLPAQETVFRSGYENFEPPVLVSEKGPFPPDNRIGAVGISDADGSTLEYARVAVSTGYRTNNDVLSYVDSTEISGTWDSVSGEMVLDGTASHEDYETALRRVLLEDTENIPGDASRTVSITVNDGIGSSNTLEHDCAMYDVSLAIYLRIAAETDGIDGLYFYSDDEGLSNGVPIYRGRELTSALFVKASPVSWELTSNNGVTLMKDAIPEEVTIPEGSSEWTNLLTAETETVTINSLITCEFSEGT